MTTYTCSYEGGWNQREDDGPCFISYLNKEDMYAMEKDGVVSLFCQNCGPESIRMGWSPAALETKTIRPVPEEYRPPESEANSHSLNFISTFSQMLSEAENYKPQHEIDLEETVGDEIDFLETMAVYNWESALREEKDNMEIIPELGPFLSLMYYIATNNYEPLTPMQQRELRLALKKLKIRGK